MADFGSAYDDDNDSLWDHFEESDSSPKKSLVSGQIGVAPAYADDNAYAQIDSSNPHDNNAYSNSPQPLLQPPPSKPTNAFDSNTFVPSSHPSVTHEDLDRREANLRARERELENRRTRLDQQDKDVNAGGGPEYNWPCRWYPLAYHSITDEIPAAFRPHMRRMYILVLLTFFALIVNAAAQLAAYLVVKTGGDSSKILLALVFVAAGTFGAWKMWYRQIYYAIRDKRSIRWWVFFLFFAAHVCFCGAGMVGWPTTGLAGWITMIETFKFSSPAGIVCFISSAFWTADFFGSVYYMRKSFQIYQTGGNHAQAQTELMQGIVQHAVTNELVVGQRQG